MSGRLSCPARVLRWRPDRPPPTDPPGTPTMARDHILAIDQGTTSTRSVVYDARLRPLGQGQVEVPPSFPQPGWVEHDPTTLVGSVGPTVTQALAEAGVGADR